jgi:hypothetical protein
MDQENELDLLRRLHRSVLAEEELLELFYANRDRYRVLFHLLQQPKFPDRIALNIIPRLYAMDLVRVIKNKRGNPYIRKRCELEFVNKYPRFPLGEKLAYMKIMPASLLDYFIEEKDTRIIEAMLGNAYCTEELVMKMINRSVDRFSFYQVVMETEWYKRPQVAVAIAHDDQATVRMLMTLIPFLNVRELEKLYMSGNTHQNVKKHIIRYMQKRNPPDQ